MKKCDNSTRKIRISSNFILSISLLIMSYTLLLRPPLNCNTRLHFTTLHPTVITNFVCRLPLIQFFSTDIKKKLGVMFSKKKVENLRQNVEREAVS